ncbi:ERBB-3 BINDING PROTEIN 1 isoform X1 [Glycine max]|uniref:ERBB-3 BINDING PROTEIN 1 isoform X1 n=1 Tax=Glycine max TaxID=3847 RepID=UPI0007192361|nr:ERBB-3 BINDING PROTEIN 1-like isoform X1 [Glycine max]|eukprot:XP_014625740.1 ERBB-3 BINDING PROTEIN 1-like isoform X2 [Glycine max]
MSDDEREEKELDLSSAEVVTKYKTTAEIVNKCKPKAKIVDICEKGDSYIREQTGNVYKNVKRKIERCVAFPTCLSVNSVVCHFSPMESVVSAIILKLMFVSLVGCSDMACHIDGFITAVAHTHVLQEGPVAATNTAAEVALRLVRPGKKVINCNNFFLLDLHLYNTS